MLQSAKSARGSRPAAMGVWVALWGTILTLGSASFVWFASAWFVRCAVLGSAPGDVTQFVVAEMIAFVAMFLLLGLFAIHRMTATVTRELERLDALHGAAKDARALRRARRQLLRR